MSMDDKDWDESQDFWDNEDDDDEEEHNGLDGDVDRNNDETFNDATEWNEDEHEEMIARDLILSSNHQRGSRNNNSNSNDNNNHSIGNNPRLIRNSETIPHSCRRALDGDTTSNNNGTTTQHFALFASDLESSGNRANWNSTGPPSKSDANTLAYSREKSRRDEPRSSTSHDTSWQAPSRSHLQQLQQQAEEQLRLLHEARSRLPPMNAEQRMILQQRQFEQMMQQRKYTNEASLDNLNLSRPLQFSNDNSDQRTVTQPKVLTLDELERQLLKTSINQTEQQPQKPQQARLTRQLEPSRRAGWSPFGGKDLFDTDDPNPIPSELLLLAQTQPHALTVAQQQLLQEQARILQEQNQLRQLAYLKQHDQQQQQEQHQRQIEQQIQHQHRHLQQLQLEQQQRHQRQLLESNQMPQAQCFTAEELERQIMASRAANIQRCDSESMKGPVAGVQEKMVRNEPKKHPEENRGRVNQERRNGERHDRFDRRNRDATDSRDHYRDRRENKNQREHHRHHRKEPTIIPPQVQLCVIDKAKRLHSITTMHSDEFLQDRMPTSSDGFRFVRHSNIADKKANHDGVLTDKERDWLTRIQEKIQADYDDNIDQDYYYLLYFNRSSMSDEANQKPTGPGVFDRRFIPRERLLYNSGL